ncbi:metal ABC transporter ATPase [Methylacidiphilum kamchatkense Kam1]|uniref:P-type Zn(2+) transporter n=1 Tax=Methylacidiphilum kamchatkense Kam1 TaxID=1202785 RepID=A0A0C1RX02_9BACT|nr:heavy metal translocating P-type ATPase [Methylacidiphilum kamchatkense]KIE59451.1 metal ABC transporter ATPase [Methylacidiphilum kamchatkense Kam1]QDQ42554.1 heavy metal-(Cd/Co/Hg/Pb/Zn)-translocating P-type ATPase [Methylacidiphilum kamchatkense Kam1]
MSPETYRKTVGQKRTFIEKGTELIALGSLLSIIAYVVLRYLLKLEPFVATLPLFFSYSIGGIPLLIELGWKLFCLEFGSDLLAGISIISSFLLGEYLAGAIVILMLSGGQLLERLAIYHASAVLRALAQRMPTVAHQKLNASVKDIGLKEVIEGIELIIYPHEICPADGVVIEGKTVMDESYLTGEPFMISKTVGSTVLSGAINGNAAIRIRVLRKPEDSRYAKIMEVIRKTEEAKPRIRRLAEQIGAFYTPLAIFIATAAGMVASSPLRFLSVMVIATPCPLLLAIPVAILGSISLCARRSIVVKDSQALELISKCQTAIFDKTGTLTYGLPKLVEESYASFFEPRFVFELVASLERYSKHPLAAAVLQKATEKKIEFRELSEVHEPSGKGLYGQFGKMSVRITTRSKLPSNIKGLEQMPRESEGLECVVLIDEVYAATFRFRDAPREESKPFIAHLSAKHGFKKVLIVSGDRESEVRYLAKQVGVSTLYAQCSPEQKLEIVRKETNQAKTLFVGDGINDAPAMMVATVGIAVGLNSEPTTEAAKVVIMENTLMKVDEFLHIGRRMRMIALQSAIGGMMLSCMGMGIAAIGGLTPVEGAIFQEIIDVFSLLNALRTVFPPKTIRDF